MKNLKLNPFIYFLLSILYLEILSKIVIAKQIFNIGLLYMIIFTIPIILLLMILTKAFKEKTNKIILFILMGIITIYFEIQYIFYNLFSVPFSFSTIGLADQALDFTSIIKDAILSHLPIFMAILIPFIILIIINKKIDTTKYQRPTIGALLIMAIIMYA